MQSECCVACKLMSQVYRLFDLTRERAANDAEYFETPAGESFLDRSPFNPIKVRSLTQLNNFYRSSQLPRT